MEKEEIVTSENSIYIDGLRLSQRLLDLAKEYADFKTAGEFHGLMMALHIVYYECCGASAKKEKQNDSETV